MKYVLIVVFALTITLCFSHSSKTNVYLIPGMGTDHRIFDKLNLSEDQVNIVPIKWGDYSVCRDLADYAKVLSLQVDTTRPHILLGVSMGGMLAMEISRLTKPEAIILISSAKSGKEIPNKYKVGRFLPAYKLLNEKKLDRIVENERTFKDVKSNKDKRLYRVMLHDCGADFLKWQIHSICGWRYPQNNGQIPIYHIHGGKDKILPVKRIKYNVCISDGTHKMIVNQRNSLKELIDDEINRVLKVANSKG